MHLCHINQRNHANCVGILMANFSCHVFALNYQIVSQSTFREVLMHIVLGLFFHQRAKNCSVVMGMQYTSIRNRNPV